MMWNKKKYIKAISFVMTFLIFIGSVIPAAAMGKSNLQSMSFTGTDAEWETLREEAKNHQRRVIFDNDGDDAYGFPNGLTPSIENILAQRTSFLKDYPVDTITYGLNHSAFDHLVTRTTKGYVADKLSPSYQNLTKWLHDQGTDALQLQMDYARENDMEIFAEIRMNDVHDVGHTEENPNPMYSPYKTLHPEFLIGGEDENGRPNRNMHKFGLWSSYDYTHEELRDHFYEVIDELLTDYASQPDGLDGIVFNFYREGVLFKSVTDGGTITQADLDSMTELFNRIRARAEEIGKQRGRPILIAVKLPADSVAYCRAIGIDLETWLDDNHKLVDLVIGGIHLEPWRNMVDYFHGKGVKYYAQVEREWAAMDSVNPAAVKRNDMPGYRASTAAAMAAGVDGIQFFNLVTESHASNFMHPDDTLLQYENKRYFPTIHTTSYQEFWLKGGSELDSELPRVNTEEPILVLPGKENELYLEIGDDLAAAQAAGKLEGIRASIFARVAKPQDLIVKIGEYSLTYQTSVGDIHYFSVPYQALKVGLNKITLSLPTTGGSSGEYVDTILRGDVKLSGAVQVPWRRTLLSGTGSSETIVDGTYCITDGSDEGRPSIHYSLALPADKRYTAEHPLVINFSCKVEKADDDRSVVLHVTDGQYVSMVSLMTNKVKLLGAADEYSMNTTQDLSLYQLRITDTTSTLLLFKEGAYQPILNANHTEDRKVLSDSAIIPGTGAAAGGFNEHGVLFGSLSLEGKSVAYWKDIQVVRAANSAWVNDMCVDIGYTQEVKTPREVFGNWQISNANKTTLSIGNRAYTNLYMAAEVDLQVTSGAAEVIVSNGGTMVRQVITPQMTLLQDGSAMNWEAVNNHTRRVELDASGSLAFSSSSGASAAMGLTYVSAWLNTNKANYTTAEQTLIRNGGVLVKPLEGGIVNVSAIRASVSESYLYKPEAEWLTLFKDNGTSLSAAGWTVTNPAAAVKAYIVDAGATTANKPAPGQYLAFLDAESLTATGKSTVGKALTIGSGEWTLEIDANFKELIQLGTAPTEISKFYWGFGVDIYAAGKRWKVNFTDQNKVFVAQDSGEKVMSSVIEFPVVDNEFHRYTLHNDGKGKLSIGRDGILLGAYGISGRNTTEPDAILISNQSAVGMTGKNEVYLENIALYKGKNTDLKQPATVTMSDGTAVYNGEPHSLAAATVPADKTVEYRYKGINGTVYPESSSAPTHAGTYEVTAQIADAEYTGSTTAVMTIEKAQATAVEAAGTLVQGQSLADTRLSGMFKGVKNEELTGTITWDSGNDTVPTETGDFAYTFTPNSPNYLPITGTMTVAVKAVYTITYDANGGAGTMVESTGIAEGTSGAAITLLANGFTAPEGMQFKEWAIGSINGEVVSAGSTYTFSADTTVYAIWEDIPENAYAITVQAEGYGTAIALPENAVEGEEITLIATPESGYRFKAWQVISGGVDIIDNRFIMPAGEVTVKAIFEVEPPETYTVTFDSNGGSAVTAIADVTSGSAITAPIAPTKEGYTFAGWYKEGMLENAWDFAADIVTSDITLYAKWEQNSSGGETPSPVINYYTITATAGEGGKISPQTSSVAEYTTKIFIITADEGYTIADVTVDGKSAGAVSSYTFSNVTGGHSISATFKKLEKPEEPETPEYENPFDDVNENQWFYDSVMYVYQHGLMSGVSTDTFNPLEKGSRGMIVTILHNLEGKPGAGASDFKDVTDGQWYTAAITWAAENKIVSGYGNGMFGPNDNITREQMAAIFYNYAKHKGYDLSMTSMPLNSSLESFTDNSEISGWASEALQWMVGSGMMSGKGNNMLDPKGAATRAEMASIMQKFAGKYSNKH